MFITSPIGNNKNNECNMRKIKSELVNAGKHDIVILQDTPQHQGLVKANRFLLLLASMLMVIVFVFGFLLLPSSDILDNVKVKQEPVVSIPYSVQNPVLSAEINTLKGQLVGLVSGSIESKLRSLEQSIKSGSINTSLGTIQDIKNDVSVLKSYSTPETKVVQSQSNASLLEEVSHLKNLIYFTLSSCGLMLAAVCGVWIRSRYRLGHPHSFRRAELGKHKN